METSLLVKVIEGTPVYGKGNLCETCSYGMVIKAKSGGRQIVYCTRYGDSGKLPFEVGSCTDYYRRGLPALRDMYETAWILTTDKTHRQIGFVPYQKWRESNKGSVIPGED